jgi:diguanylate cyclase (GGDEF)-like protein
MASSLYYSHKLRELGCSDGLTQVANRRSFDHYLEQRLWERKDLSLILCDVDFFKAYNDCYGHQSGDRCLQQIAEAIRRAVRRRDLVARYGGEEFAIILPDTTAQTAFYIAERIQYQIRQLHIPHLGSKVDPYVTVSLGLASAPYSARLLPSDLIAAADQALYQAKLLGRNQIVLRSDFTHGGIVNQKSFL